MHGHINSTDLLYAWFLRGNFGFSHEFILDVAIIDIENVIPREIEWTFPP